MGKNTLPSLAGWVKKFLKNIGSPKKPKGPGTRGIWGGENKGYNSEDEHRKMMVWKMIFLFQGCMIRLHVSHEKNPPTFHYTGWLIGILKNCILIPI